MLLFKEERKACFTIEYFQNKLKLNFKDEEIRYKKIYNDLNLRDRKCIRGYFYDSHKAWEESITERIENLTNADLQELYFWIENQKNLMESGTQMLNTFLLAFAAAVFANMLIVISEFSLGDSLIDTIVHIILFVIRYAVILFAICSFIRYTFYRVFHINVQKQFYYVLNEIVKKTIKKRKIKIIFM